MTSLSRRSFFRGIAAMAAGVAVASAIPGTLFIENPRIKAWRLLDEMETLFKSEGPSSRFMARTDELLVHLRTNFQASPHRLEIQANNVKHIIQSGRHETNWKTCCGATFSVMLLREGIKYRKLPIIRSKEWKAFARPLAPIVMAA